MKLILVIAMNMEPEARRALFVTPKIISHAKRGTLTAREVCDY